MQPMSNAICAASGVAVVYFISIRFHLSKDAAYIDN